MTAVVSLLVVLGFSFLIIRLFTAALALTGLSKPLARLQAISAFTGVGFTTTESEHMVNHPVRRHLLTILMILGNAGFVTAASTLILSFTDVGETSEALLRSALILAGVGALVLVARSSWVDEHLHRFIEWALRRWTRLETVDVIELLGLQDDYQVRDMEVEEDDWVTDRELQELNLFEEGVSVLGIYRQDRYLGVPRGETEIEAGDRLVLYGHIDDLEELDERKAGAEGDEAHREAVRDQQEKRRAQAAREEGREEKRARRGAAAG